MGMAAIIAVVTAIGAAGHGARPAPHQPAQAFGNPYASSAGLTGRASVIDGDTIEIHGQRIRLFGIDAPESSQSCEDASGAPYPCGRRAAQELDRMTEGKVVSCLPRDTDHYGRVVAVCSAAGVDLNGWMVSRGQAIAYTRYGADYAGVEGSAKASGRGIWQGRFQEPARYRADQKGRSNGYASGY